MSTPASNEIREQLQRICESDTFRSAPQVSRLLIFLVDATIEGNPPKELSVGASFFRRLPGYDSQADPVVRTEVRRLRLKLGEYYFKEGSGAPILIEIPAGGYKAKFTMREVAPAAAAPEVPAAAPLLIQTAASVKPRARVPAKILVAAAALLLAGAGLWLLPRLTSRPAAARRSIAVFRLTDLAGAGDTAWLGAALSQLIAADLSANSALRIVSIADVVRTRLDLGLGDDTDSLAPSELSRIRRSLDADLVIAGSYASTGPAGSRQYRIDLRVYDARTGAASGAVSDTDVGDERTLFDLVSRVEARIGRQAGVEMAASQEQSDSAAQVGGARPAGLELARSLCLQADLLPYGSAAKESLYRKSLEAGRKEGPGPWQVDPLVGLAKIQAGRRDFGKAADFYRQAYEVTLKYYGPDHGATAAAKIQWARSRMRTGEVREAIDQIKEAIPVARREFPPDSLRLWNILHDAVHACNDGKAFRQAESYTVEALAINESLRLPPTSERWGMLYWDLGRAKRGERNYRDAIAAFEKAEADFQQFTDTRAREVQEDIEQLKAEQRADAAPAK